MNYNKILFLVLFVSVGISCKKHKSQTEIVVEYPIILADNFEVALDTLPLDQYIIRESFAFPIDLDSELSKHGTNKKSIKSAHLVSLKLQVLDYAYADSTKYDNFKDLSEMYMDIKFDGIGQQQIASKTFIPDIRTKVINLDMANVDITRYLQQETIKMVFKYKKRRQMHNEMPYIISGKFSIVADPL